MGRRYTIKKPPNCQPRPIKGGESWYFEPQHRDRHLMRRRKVGDTLTMSLADIFAEVRLLNAELDKARAGTGGGDSGAIPGTIRFVVVEFRRSPAYLMLGERTKADYDAILDWIVAKFGNSTAKSWTPAAAVKLVETQLETDGRGRLTRTGYYKFQVLRRLVRWGAAREHFTVNPLADYRAARIPVGGQQVWLPEHQPVFVRQARSRPDNEGFARAMWLGIYTGQRPEDIVRMCATDIVKLTLVDEHGGDAEVEGFSIVQMKRNRRVFIPIHSELAAEMATWPRRPGPFVLTRRGRVMSPSYLSRGVLRICRAAGLPTGLTPKQWRHTAATRLSEAGCTETQIAAILGHADEATTRRHYIQRTTSTAVAAMKRWDRK
ncbi:MAG: tyrosine-type recombinase/integrase [Pseudomonadota bacterium]